MSLGRILAAVLGKRRAWRVELVRSGKDLNGRTRTAAMLRATASLFEGRPLKVLDLVTADGRRINEHQQIEGLIGLEALNTVGHLENARYDDRAFGGVGGTVADAVLMEGVAPADRIQERLEALAANGGLTKNPIGLSFSGFGRKDDRGFETIELVDSVDFVTHPAAYGRVAHRLAASVGSVPMKELLAYFTRLCASLVEGLPANIATDYALGKHMADRLKASAATPEAALVKAATAVPALGLDADALKKDPLDAAMKLIEVARASLAAEQKKTDDAAEAARIAASKTEDPEVLAARERATKAADEIEALAGEHRLKAACEQKKIPAKVTERLLASYKGKPVSVEAATKIAADKAQEIDDLRTTEIGGRVEIVQEKRDRLVTSLSRMLSDRIKWDPKDGMDPQREFMGSLHRFARLGFGIDLAEAAMGETQRRDLRVKASIDGVNFDACFAESLNRSLLAEYAGDGSGMDWRSMVHVVPEKDFREKSVIVTGYYSDLPVVAEGAAYEPLTTPGDRVEKYTMEKSGGTEDITWEKVLNDDLGLFAQMIRRLGRLCRVVITERFYTQVRIASQKTMADGAKLTSAAGGRVDSNLSTVFDLGTGDATAWGHFINAVLLMQAQTGGSGEPKGITPKHIIIPTSKAKALGSMFADFSAAAADIPTRRGLEILGASLPEVHIDRRTTLTKDWFLVADWRDAEVFRLAFLGGREEPETIIADGQNFGSMFTNDKIVIKVRHPYVFGVVDYAGIEGNDIA